MLTTASRPHPCRSCGSCGFAEGDGGLVGSVPGGDRKASRGSTDPSYMHSPDADRISTLPPLHSSFAEDPDLRDLVVLFVDELDGRIASIQRAFDERDLAELCRIAHQLKGSAGGYGFDPIGDAAGRLEYELRGDEAAESTIGDRVEDLVTTCRAAVRPSDN